jgi:hypothetical protein
MIRSAELIDTTMKLWTDRHTGGAVQTHVQREMAYDATSVVMTTQNYCKRSISGLQLAQVSGTQDLMRLIECYLTQDLYRLADQLEKVAFQIRSGLR